MNKYFKILIMAIFVLTINTKLKAQTNSISEQAKDFCGTSQYYEKQNMKILNNTNEFNKQNLKYLSVCVKLYFHIMRKSDGSGGVTPSNISESYNILVNDFYKHKIYFDWDGTIDYINNTYFYNDPVISSLNIFLTNDHYNGVDIYIFGDECNSNNKANGVGIASGIICSGGFWKPPYEVTSRTHIISHEMGHVLGLWHTMHGGFAESPSGADPSECPELVNGSNSSTCGDYVTDTPADISINGDVDNNCNWLQYGNYFDANGQPYNPATNNNMSYSIPACIGVFTPKQGERMRKALMTLPFLQACSRYGYNDIDPSLLPHPCTLISPVIIIMPNPADLIVNFEINQTTYNLNYQLYNSTANLILQGKLNNINSTINTSTLQNGTYYFHLFVDSELIIKTIIINHKN